MSKQHATIYDVAEAAYVSIATVSRVINGAPNVRPEMRHRVNAAIKQLNFSPSSVSRSSDPSKKWTIGLAYPLYEHSDVYSASSEEDENVLFMDAVIRGASTQASLLGYSLFSCAVPIGHSHGMEPLQQLSRSVDAVILTDRVFNDVGVMRFAKRMRTVHLSGSIGTNFGATVRVDNERGMSELVSHLSDAHGIKDFGFIGGVANSPDAIARLDAFTAAVNSVGGQARTENILSGEFSMLRAEAEVDRRLTMVSPLPEAFVCANDQMALGAVHALTRHGIEVPSQMKVTGFDDVPMVRKYEPGLTTVHQSFLELGATAVEAAVGLLDGLLETGSVVSLPTEIVIRSSCGCTQ
jgi:LacI family transcriptional regulator